MYTAIDTNKTNHNFKYACGFGLV